MTMKTLRNLFAWFVVGAVTVLSCQCVCAQSASCETVQKVSQTPKCHGGSDAPAEKHSQEKNCCGNCLKSEIAASTVSLKPGLSGERSQLPDFLAEPPSMDGRSALLLTKFLDTSGPPLRPSLFTGHLYAPRAPPIAV